MRRSARVAVATAAAAHAHAATSRVAATTAAVAGSAAVQRRGVKREAVSTLATTSSSSLVKETKQKQKQKKTTKDAIVVTSEQTPAGHVNEELLQNENDSQLNLKRERVETTSVAIKSEHGHHAHENMDVKRETTGGGEWHRLCTTHELSCKLTLASGQVFSWRFHGHAQEWSGVIGDNVFALRERDQCVEFQCLHPLGFPAPQAHEILTHYFRLEIDAAPLYKLWTAQDDKMAQLIRCLPGYRIVRQDPVECLFAFICSSNNNIQRIQQMVDKLRATYGTLLCTVASDSKQDVAFQGSSHSYYSFPSTDTLAEKCEEATLRTLGFGYRAPFITKSSQQLVELGGVEYLRQLRDWKPVVANESDDYQEKLMVFMGVGRKVADCIGLFSLEKLDAIPVDTHVWQIACREFDASLKDKKSITPSVYKVVGDYFRSRFSPFAGWAHSVLFTGDLSSFQSHLPTAMQKKKKKKTAVAVAMSVKEETTSSVKTKDTKKRAVKAAVMKEELKAPVKMKKSAKSVKTIKNARRVPQAITSSSPELRVVDWTNCSRQQWECNEKSGLIEFLWVGAQERAASQRRFAEASSRGKVSTKQLTWDAAVSTHFLRNDAASIASVEAFGRLLLACNREDVVAMEPTVFVCLVTAIACALLAIDGTACLVGVDEACVLDRASNIVMVIIGAVTLVPVLAALYTAWLDHRSNCRDERTGLLETGDENANATPKRVLMYLYTSHFLSAWGDRMWQFAIPILFMEVFVDTLLPSATFSLVMYTTCIFAIPSVGKYLDTANRWTVMKYSIVVENLMIVLSAAMLGLILLITNADGIHKPEWTWKLLGLFGVTLVCGGVGQVLNDAQTLAIERDWVVVIAGDDSNALAHLNTMMRRIDLSCKILAPMAFGIVMDFAGDDPTTRAMIGAAAVGIWNLLSTPLEYFMTKDIYDLNLELAVKDISEEDAHEQRTGTTQSTFARYSKMWKDYLHHPVFLLSFAFCSLYMTILDGGALNTAYLKWRGIPDSILGSSRGAGAVFGLIGTFIFPYIRKLVGRVERVAVMSVWLFWLCLAPVILAFVFAGESVTSDYVMLGCMVVSRIWLWSADLAETQIMQEWIEPHRRGSINSMQTATYQFFYIMIQFMGIVFHDPRQFEALVIFSLATVFSSAIGFTVWDLKYGRRRDVYVRKVTSSSSPQKTQ